MHLPGQSGLEKIIQEYQSALGAEIQCNQAHENRTTEEQTLQVRSLML